MKENTVQYKNIIERLNKIEKKIDNRLSKTWLSISDVVRETGLSRSTIYRSINLGRLKCTKSSGKKMFRREWVDKWIQR